MGRLTPQDFAVADKFLQCGVHLNKGTEHEFVQYTMMNGGLDLSDPAVIESLHNLYWAFCIQVRGNWEAPSKSM